MVSVSNDLLSYPKLGPAEKGGPLSSIPLLYDLPLPVDLVQFQDRPAISLNSLPIPRHRASMPGESKPSQRHLPMSR